VLTTITDEVDKKMNKSQQNLDNGNDELKETIDKIGGGSNCCLNILLILQKFAFSSSNKQPGLVFVFSKFF
jgi:hypothetical protein